MVKCLFKILFIFILIFEIYGCTSNNSEESNYNVSLKDTSTKMSVNIPEDNFGFEDTSNLYDNQTSLVEDKITSISEIYKKSRKKASVFVINTNRDTVIKCKEGTLISIPANSFERVKDQSSIDGNIKLSINEFYTVSDMLLANLTTSSGGNMIETGGMFFISANAKDNNDSLTLKKGKNITIALPTSESENTDGMQLFNGVHDSDAINWEPKGGITGFAQRWRAGRSDFSLDKSFKNSFIFPDQEPKKIPTLINKSQQNFTTELLMPIREVIQNSSGITRSAVGYIDTLGTLHGYLIGNKKNSFEFKTNYTQSFSENINVNIAVSFKVKTKTKANVNLKYFDKLFKMGKGNPDSLVAVTVTFIPTIKRINYERLKSAFKNAITVSMYKNKLLENKKRQLAYEKHIKLLEANPLSNINNAQEYLLLSTQKLGWINCDRFYNNTNKIDYFVKLNEKANLLIVFNNIKSILSSDSKGIFHNVPLGEKITIVALKTDKGRIMLAIQETSITEKPFDNLQFKQISLNEYKTKLQKLNSI